MKYLATIVLALFVSVAMGQRANNITGPAAKNYKAWKDSSLQGTQVNLASTSDKYEEGAKAKNSHIVGQEVAVTVVPNTNAKRAKGANAKNRRFAKVNTVVTPTPSKETKKEKVEKTDPIIQRR